MKCVAVALSITCLVACTSSSGEMSWEDPEPVQNTSFTLVVLPDTQGYSQLFPDIFEAQTRWIAQVAEELNIKLVVQVGDLVEGSWIEEQWDVAQRAMGHLDGVVPYIVALGNHDLGMVYEERNARGRSTYFHTYFPRSLFEAMPTFGGGFPDTDSMENTYHVFEHAGQHWLVIALEFGPRDAALAWASDVIRDHPDHLTILATHAYLYSDNTRYDWARYGTAQMWNPYSYGVAMLPDGVNDGEDIWNAVASQHPNVVAVLSGHVLNDGLGYAVSEGAGEVHEILANYQMNEMAGEGYLRLMHFNISTSSVEVRTYSPWLDTYKTDAANEFMLSYASHVPPSPSTVTP